MNDGNNGIAKPTQNEEKTNQAVDKINAVHNNVANNHPNTALHKTPLPYSSGLGPKKDNTGVNSSNRTINSPKRNRGYNDPINNSRIQNSKKALRKNNSKSGSKTFGERIAGVKSHFMKKTNGSTNNALETAKRQSDAQNSRGFFGRALDMLGGEKTKDEIHDANGKVSSRKKRRIGIVLVPVILFSLMFFTIYLSVCVIAEYVGIPEETVLDKATPTLEKNLDKSTDKDLEKVADKVLYNNSTLVSLQNTNSIYSIKLNGVNILATTKYGSGNPDFDINLVSDLYPPSKDYMNVEYSAAFFYKLYKLNSYYTNLCNGKQVLDLPLLMITLQLESDNMADVFASNLGYMNKTELTTASIDKTFEQYFDYKYDWSKHEYLRHNSIHDMEILAQHMVELKGSHYCVYNSEKYNEFLEEFIEKKYYLSTDRWEKDSVHNKSSSNRFSTYSLTEDQLLQIASLCAQEQGHSNPQGAAAEASLMANKFEIDGTSLMNEYPNSGEALYRYVKEANWWADAEKYMNRKNASEEIVDAVRDVLVNGYRTLPKYVVSHDCPNCGSKICDTGKKGDICYVTTNNIQYTTAADVENRNNYIPYSTIIKNAYGSTNIFWGFPSSAKDPFSYKSEELRQKFGECYYDFEKGSFVNCKDFKDIFTKWMVDIANDDTHGYSQLKRTSLIDFDCSSMVYYGLLNSGFTTNELGGTPFTTHYEREILKKAGFTEIALNPSNLNTLQKGDILWREGHTEVYIGGNMTVGAHRASNKGISDGQYGDQDGGEISVVNIANDWQYAYRYER